MYASPTNLNGSHRVKTQQMSRLESLQQLFAKSIRVIASPRSLRSYVRPCFDDLKVHYSHVCHRWEPPIHVWHRKNTYLGVDHQVSRYTYPRPQDLHHWRFIVDLIKSPVLITETQDQRFVFSVKAKDAPLQHQARYRKYLRGFTSIRFWWCLMECQGRTNPLLFHPHPHHLLAWAGGKHDRG